MSVILKNIEAHQLEVGMVIPWPIYSQSGQLLMIEGSTLSNEGLLNKIISHKACRPADEEDSTSELPQQKKSAFQIMNDLKIKHFDSLNNLEERSDPESIKQIEQSIDELGLYTWKYADLFLGALLLDRESPYTMLHPILTSIISILIAKKLKLETETIQSIIAAALTANVGMLKFQEELTHQTEAPTAKQKQVIFEHPEKSCEILKKAGVQNKAWLEFVLKHHEKIDGEGYPNKLCAVHIPTGAKIISLADIYAAMVLPRNYRDGIRAQGAIREIFTHRGKDVDANLTDIFIKEIGVYPPGGFVELDNGEKGIVIRRGVKKANKPVVSVIVDKYDNDIERPKIRDTIERDEFNVRCVIPNLKITHDLPAVWGIK